MRSDFTRVGFTLIEVSAAAVILAAVFVFVAQASLWTVAHRSMIDRRQTALIEAENVLEELASIPWNDLSANRAAEMRLSSSAEKRLGNDALAVSVSSADDSSDAKRVVVEVRFANDNDSPALSVRLATWVYR